MDLEGLLGEMIGMLAVGGGLFVAAFSIFIGAKDRQLQRESISRERIALIEKGMDPALAYQRPTQERGPRALFWGLTLTGLGFGLLAGTALIHYLNKDDGS